MMSTRRKNNATAFIPAVFCLAIVLGSTLEGLVHAEDTHRNNFLVNTYVFEFEKTKGIRLEVFLSEQQFRAVFGNNTDIPLTDEEVIDLANKLYPPQEDRYKMEGMVERMGKCREYEVGLLFAALQNPAISDITRYEVDSIIKDSEPELPKTYIRGHFKFSYTDSDVNADNNVTLAEIKKTAAELNNYWNKYSANFKTPKHYESGGKDMIDIKVYYLGNTLLGETNSAWDYINLNSKLCVKDACARKTVSAHELFHRVQYVYGYVTGTANMQWIVEGTADWSQRYTNLAIRDYMESMNSGLDKPDVNLIGGRSYNACYFWIYLQRRGEWGAVRDVWSNYEANGHDAKAAVDTVVGAKLDTDFDGYVQLWSQANYIKDLSNAGLYDYTEDEVTKTSCGIIYGPLSHVPRTSTNVDSTTNWSNDDSVSPYGTDYYEFNLDPAMESVNVEVDGDDAGDFSYHFIGIKNNKKMDVTSTTTTDYTYDKALSRGQWDKLAVVVSGMENGGNYAISIGSCITGVWLSTDKPSISMNLAQSGNSISGTWINTDHAGCGYEGTGSYDAGTIVITFSSSASDCCSQFTYTGTVADCSAMSLTYTNVCGVSGTRYFIKSGSNAAYLPGIFDQNTVPAECFQEGSISAN